MGGDRETLNLLNLATRRWLQEWLQEDGYKKRNDRHTEVHSSSLPRTASPKGVS
jgi:hypothetical protein